MNLPPATSKGTPQTVNSTPTSDERLSLSLLLKSFSLQIAGRWSVGQGERDPMAVAEGLGHLPGRVGVSFQLCSSSTALCISTAGKQAAGHIGQVNPGQRGD